MVRFKMISVYILCMLPILILPNGVFAGDLNPPGPPVGTMTTLEEIYNQNEAILNILQNELDCASAMVPKTGQSQIYVTNDDASLHYGVESPDPRFIDNGNGTITDNLTSLVWLKDASRFGNPVWDNAIAFCNSLADDGSNLTDGSVAGDWRLPSLAELKSLRNFNYHNPCIPNQRGNGQWVSGDPFINIQSARYWSGSTSMSDTAYAWIVDMADGYLGDFNKTFAGSSTPYVWLVRNLD